MLSPWKRLALSLLSVLLVGGIVGVAGATALVEEIELVTHDRLIRKSGLIPVIW
jgi:hypothetical protein